MIRFKLHGISIGVTCDNETFAEQLVAHNRFLLDPTRSLAPCDIDLAIQSEAEYETPYMWSPSRRENECSFDLGRKIVAVRVDVARARATVDVANVCDLPLDTLINATFLHPLRFAIKRWGLFFMHGSCVALDADRGVLIVGYPRSGKTSLALSLLWAGYAYLAEEAPLLAVREGRAQILAYPEPLALRPETFDCFPELSYLRRATMPGRQRVAPAAAGAGAILETCRPRLLLLPQYRSGEALALEALDGADALTELVRLELVVYQHMGLTPEMTRTHMDTLGYLAEQTTAYRLTYNDENLREAPARITELLGRA